MVRTDGWSVGHVIIKFSGMGRFICPWCSAGALRAELRYKRGPWSLQTTMIHARQNFKLTSSSHRKKIANLVSITITFRCTCYFDWKTFSFPKDDHWNFFNSIQASIWWVKNRMQLPQQVPDIRKTRVEGHGERNPAIFFPRSMHLLLNKILAMSYPLY